jgi:cell filamentation protein
MELTKEEKAAMKAADFIEGKKVADRNRVLVLNPIQGNFDRQHLVDIHSHLFQDFPKFWFTDPEGVKISDDLPVDYYDFEAGSFRYTVEPWNAWKKDREYPSLNDQPLTSFYARLNDQDIKHLDKILSDVNTHALSKLEPPEFAEKLAHIYAELDYVHPFQEGNSRTLREFTRELAAEAGYQIDWSVFNTPDGLGREQLYAARDLSLFERAKVDYEHTEDCDIKLKATHDALVAHGFDNLQDLFKNTQGFIEPLHSPRIEIEHEAKLSSEHNFSSNDPSPSM